MWWLSMPPLVPRVLVGVCRGVQVGWQQGLSQSHRGVTVHGEDTGGGDSLV